jgi:hypothetical protein
MSDFDRQSITFRPVREDDREFMAALYASTRAEEMQFVPWEPEQKAMFLAMQFGALCLVVGGLVHARRTRA